MYGENTRLHGEKGQLWEVFWVGLCCHCFFSQVLNRFLCFFSFSYYTQEFILLPMIPLISALCLNFVIFACFGGSRLLENCISYPWRLNRMRVDKFLLE